MLKTFLLLCLIVILAVAVAVLWNYWRFCREIGAEAAQLQSAAQPAHDTTITEEMLASLPEPARRYFQHSGVVGKQIPRIVRLRQTGRIRSSEGESWMKLEAEEIYSTNPPAFVWQAWMPSKAVPIVLGRDQYASGHASILMKMLASFPVANQSGPELGNAGLMRYLNEMMWFPAAYLGPNVRIEPVDDTSFSVAITDSGLEATATIVTDQQGRVTNFIAPRFNTATGSMEEWQTPITAYAEFADMNLPVAGSAFWKLDQGDFTYIELEIHEVAYDH